MGIRVTRSVASGWELPADCDDGTLPSRKDGKAFLIIERNSAFSGRGKAH